MDVSSRQSTTIFVVIRNAPFKHHHHGTQYETNSFRHTPERKTKRNNVGLQMSNVCTARKHQPKKYPDSLKTTLTFGRQNFAIRKRHRFWSSIYYFIFSPLWIWTFCTKWWARAAAVAAACLWMLEFFFGSTFLEAKEPNFSFGSPFNVWQELLVLANLRTATIDVAEPASHSCHIYNNLSAYDNVLYRSNFPQMNRIDFLVWWFLFLFCRENEEVALWRRRLWHHQQR